MFDKRCVGLGINVYEEGYSYNIRMIDRAPHLFGGVRLRTHEHLENPANETHEH